MTSAKQGTNTTKQDTRTPNQGTKTTKKATTTPGEGRTAELGEAKVHDEDVAVTALLAQQQVL